MNVYTASEGKMIWLALALLTLLNSIILEGRWTFLLYLPFLLFVLLSFIRYRFQIKGDVISFTISLSSAQLLSREIRAEQIKEAYFIKTTRSHVVVFFLKKGFRLKFSRFQPESFHEDLYAFAERQEILIKHLNHYEPSSIKKEDES
ncbi:hypothetical protein P4637_12750 [Halalkalibacterium halodurans]|jgi:hypothetical protein|uniref:BH3354 protein n=2 Tax=Halalkalibacterium halodurans TaxID=86665 RepID=Q9K7K7_HALH5|nr:hypothetical protein [Halalkalibacterium halodurans]MDY7223886.1 hypothetical protein [Halalkalibacterium halodurans]MDY7243107.1 hypothetical protein [Halalkalibacterium halodurans]MED3648757.1 hypothetical protein [Halalkalibacterium halodurans]MED4080630.1 hypothetical protein [Halalkalibacterium halodurans]MED4085683.1 hypothetical protein [Halalkalibacterium halodurans]